MLLYVVYAPTNMWCVWWDICLNCMHVFQLCYNLFQYCGSMHVGLESMIWAPISILTNHCAFPKNQCQHAMCSMYLCHHCHSVDCAKAHAYECLMLENHWTMCVGAHMYCKNQGHGSHKINLTIMCTLAQCHACVSSPHKTASPNNQVHFQTRCQAWTPQIMHFKPNIKRLVSSICKPCHAWWPHEDAWWCTQSCKWCKWLCGDALQVRID
jgi:hypothetical protein